MKSDYFWSKEDEELMRTWYPLVGAAVTSRLSVERSGAAVRKKAADLGLARGYDRLAQQSMLEALRRHGPMRISELSAVLRKSYGATEAIVRKLKDKGLIHSDKRGWGAKLHITDNCSELQSCWRGHAG